MNPNPPLTPELLIQLLAGVDFDKRYYHLAGSHAGAMNARPPASWLDTAKTFLEARPLAFKFTKREKLFSHIAAYDGCDVGLNIAFPSEQVEFILVVKVAGNHIGQPFTGLARKVGQWRDSSFAPSPPSPKIPFASAEQLQEALESGLKLFEDSRRAILTHLGISPP